MKLNSSVNKKNLLLYYHIIFCILQVMQVYQKKGRLTIVFIGNMGVKNSDPKGTRPWYVKTYNKEMSLLFHGLISLFIAQGA